MSENIDDITQEKQKNKPTVSDRAKKVTNGAKNAAKAAQKIKKSGLALKIIGFLWPAVIAILIILLLIGAYSFITTMPGMLLDKVSELAGGLWADLCNLFTGENGAYITDQDQYQLSEYIENMGYDVVGYGFASPNDVKIETDETTGEEKRKVTSKYLKAYLLADFNTYAPEKTRLKELADGSLIGGLAAITEALNGWFGEDVLKGMIVFEDDNIFRNQKIDRQSKTLTVGVWNGLKENTYTFNIDGWTGRYGKPLEFLLTLHVSTMAPDLVYELASDKNFDTKVHVSYEPVEAWITTRYLVSDDTISNLEELEKNDDTKYDVIWNVEGLEYLKDKVDGSGELSLEKDDLEKIQEIVESETDEYDSANKGFILINGWSEYFKEIIKQIDDGSIMQSETGRSLFNTIAVDNGDLGVTPNDWITLKYPGAPDDIIYETIRSISDMKGFMEDAIEQAELVDKDLEFLQEPTYYSEDALYSIEEYSPTSSYEYAMAYDSLQDRIANGETLEKEEIQTAFAATKQSLEKVIPILDEIYKNGKGYDDEDGNHIDGDLETLNKAKSDQDKIRSQLIEALLEIGLTPEAIKEASKLNDGDQGTKIKTVDPYITYVSKAWYRNVYFVIDETNIDKADIQEDKYIQQLKDKLAKGARGEDVYFSAYGPKADTKVTLPEYVFEPNKGTDEEDMKGLNGKGQFLISEVRNSSLMTQSSQPKLGEINQHTKELFAGKGNDGKNGTNPKPQYYIYNGSYETAEEIEKLKEKVEQEGAVTDEQINALDTKDVYKEIDMNKNSFAAFTILENMKTDDADFILRDFKDLLVELKYFKKSDLEDKNIGVLDWIFPAYIPESWPDSEFEKQNYQYGTYIKYRENILQGGRRNSADLDVLKISDTEAWQRLTNGMLSSRPTSKVISNAAEIRAEVKKKIIPIEVKIRTWDGSSGLKTKDKIITLQVNEELKEVWEGFFEDIYNEATDFVVADGEWGGYRIDGLGYGNVGEKSAHNYGAAVDLNWSRNPYGHVAPPTKTEWDAMPNTREKYETIYIGSKVVEIAHKYTLSWGGEWNSVYDGMHFSYFADQSRDYLIQKWGNGQVAQTTSSNAAKVKSFEDVLFIGDEFINGLKDAGLSADIKIEAENNSTPAIWLGKVDSLPTDKVKSVTVLVGGNDPSQIEQMKQLITKLKDKYSSGEIFVQEVFPVAESYSGAEAKNTKIKEFNKAIEEFCDLEENKNVTYINTSKGFIDSNGYLIEVATEDGKNLKKDVYENWITNLKNKILGSVIYAQEGIDFEDQDLITPGIGKVIEVSENSITIEFTQNNVVKGMTMMISGFDVDDGIAAGDELEKGQNIGKTLKEDILIILRAANKSVLENVEDYMPPPEYEEAEQQGGDGFSIVGTVFTESEWIAAVEAYCNNRGGSILSNYNRFFKPVISEYYNLCVSKGVNPELAFVTAITETGLSGGGVNNFYGTGTPNGSKSPPRESLLADTEIYCNAILEFQDPSGWKYEAIMKNYNERSACTENGGIDPDGYGTPDTIQGMQSLYSDLGKHEYGSSGKGGYYYMNPSRAGVTKIYATEQEFIDKCLNVDGAHAEGQKVTVYENGQYTAWQVESKVDLAKKIWGERAGTY